MKFLSKGVWLAVLQVIIVLSLGGKLLYDRATRPHVWAKTVVYDPSLPIRGRYLSLRLEVNADKIYGAQFDSTAQSVWGQVRPAKLTVEGGQLVALPTNGWEVLHVIRWRTAQGSVTALQEPVAFFVPEHAPNLWHLPAGEELWVEVTIPRKGPPRPIRLGIKEHGVLTPLKSRSVE
jgi:hypothetical protein